MIGAICLKFNEKCRAKIYLVGTYSYIDWKNECSTELGEKFVGYKYNKELGQPSVINVTQSLNGEYILRLTGKVTHFRFYINQIHKSNTYMLEPIVCKIISNELISKSELVNSLRNMGFETDENSHYADFYYVLKVKVEIENYRRKEIKITEVNNQNGNDTFSPYSPKVMFF